MSDVEAQKAADAGVEEALQNLLSAYEYTGIATGWILMAPIVDMDDKGDNSGTIWFTRDGQSWVTTLGTLEAVRIRLRSMYTTATDDDNDA